MALIQWEGKVTKLSDDPTHTVGSSALASRWAMISLSPAELLLWPSFRLWSQATAPEGELEPCRAKGYTESTKELTPGGPLPNPSIRSKYMNWVASLWNRFSRELVRRATCSQIAQHNWVCHAEARNSARGTWDICHLAHWGHRKGPCTISTLKFNWTSARFRPSHSKVSFRISPSFGNFWWRNRK